VTLRDAADFITEMPREDPELTEWQAAIEALILVVELDGPTMFACIGVVRALNAGRSVSSAMPRARKKTVRKYRIA